jgi:glycerophosphoryl diester phosphodiesterase
MWPYPKIVAHRGAGTLAPENTMAAMRCGLARGFHAVEFDVMLSKDAVPVVVHDPHFGRTIAGTGNVFDCSAQQLATLDAGSWFGPEFSGEPVPYFAQVADFCNAQGIWMNIEIKPAPGFDEPTGRVVAQWTARLCANTIAAPLLSSFSYDALLAAKVAASVIPRGYLVDTIPSDWRQRLEALEAVALHTNHKNLSPQLAQAVKDAGYGLFCYTVNEPARAREILSWGVDAFCTDRIDLIGPDFS